MTLTTAAPPAVETGGAVEPSYRRLRRSAGVMALLAPATVLLLLFVVTPVFVVSALAFFDWDPFRASGSLVGLRNFERVLGSDELVRATTNTLMYVAITVPATTIVGLIAALGIHNVGRGAVVWRTVYFLPVASTLAAMATVWRWMFYPDTGLVDRVLMDVVGLSDWLNSTALALPAIAVVGSWQAIGIGVIIYLAGLGSVPQHLYDAARMDGADAWRRFWNVTWPALGPSTAFVLIVSTGDAVRVFDQVRVMTNGGPVGSTETLSFLMWRRGVTYLDVGGASVINLVLLALILLVTAVQLATVGRRWERAGTR